MKVNWYFNFGFGSSGAGQIARHGSELPQIAAAAGARIHMGTQARGLVAAQVAGGQQAQRHFVVLGSVHDFTSMVDGLAGCSLKIPMLRSCSRAWNNRDLTVPTEQPS